MIFWIFVIGVPIFAALCGFAVAGSYWEEEDGFWWKVGSVFRGIGVFALVNVVGLLVYGIIFAIAGSIGIATTPPQHETRTVTELRALGNDLGVEGQYHRTFFLGSGYVNSDQVFSYITEQGDGGFRVNNVSADNVVVYQDSTSNTATMVDYSYKVDLWWLQPWSFDSTWDSPTEFHIPPDSITFDYNVSVTE